MRTLNYYFRRKLSDAKDTLKMRQMKELKAVMKKIYNPPFHSTKPKFRKQMTTEEFSTFNNAVKAVYNPKIKQESDLFEFLGIEKMAMA